MRAIASTPVSRASFATTCPGIWLHSCAKTVSFPLVGVGLLVFLFFTLGRYRDREKPPTPTALPHVLWDGCGGINLTKTAPARFSSELYSGSNVKAQKQRNGLKFQPLGFDWMAPQSGSHRIAPRFQHHTTFFRLNADIGCRVMASDVSRLIAHISQNGHKY